ncbi:UNVERIFIED_CONTAM: hypothetical protein FKN15_046162 [Acipenser sinensis]
MLQWMIIMGLILMKRVKSQTWRLKSKASAPYVWLLQQCDSDQNKTQRKHV